MQRLITISAMAAFLFLGAAPARSQDTGGDKGKKSAPKKETQHKGPEKKSKKGNGGQTTPPPK